MRKPIILAILTVVCALTAVSQSGRRVSTPTSATPAPVQPPANPEPSIERTVREPPAELLFLPETLREREIQALDKRSFRLADFEGKVIVINLWATWCGPCRREVPEYEKVRKDYAGREVEFIGLTTEDPETSSDRVNNFVRQIKFGFRIGWADRYVARMLMNGRSSIPQTLVIDPNGHVVKHWTGYSPGQSGGRLRQTIEHALLATVTRRTNEP